MAQDDNDSTAAADPVKTTATGAKEAKDAKSELQEAIYGSKEILATASTVFTLFPDTVTIDRQKLTITHRSFFSVAELMSIRVEDVLNVTAYVGPVFGSLSITNRVYNTDVPYSINHLWRDDTMKLKRIIQGYIIAIQKEIDVTPPETKELAAMLDELGHDEHPEAN